MSEHESKLIDMEALGRWRVGRPVRTYVPTIAEMESIYYSAINADELLYWIEDELEQEYQAIYALHQDMEEQRVNGWKS